MLPGGRPGPPATLLLAEDGLDPLRGGDELRGLCGRERRAGLSGDLVDERRELVCRIGAVARVGRCQGLLDGGELRVQAADDPLLGVDRADEIDESARLLRGAPDMEDKLARAVFPAASVAVQFTVVSPIEKIAPEAGEETTTGAASNVSPTGTPYVTTAPPGEVASTPTFVGVRTGARCPPSPAMPPMRMMCSLPRRWRLRCSCRCRLPSPCNPNPPTPR